jgi:hypothetical protein
MIQFDAESIKNRLIDRLRAKESWANVLFYSTNLRLIEIFAEELAYDMQYDEILTREAKWSQSRQTSSLLAETQFFNYVPHRKVGANGNVRVSTSSTFSASYGTNIVIPKYTIFSGLDTDFCASEDITLLSSQAYTDVPVIQGTIKTEQFSAQGLDNEYFIVYNTSFENSLFDITVNNVVYTVVNNIREAETGEALVCEVRNLNDFSGVKIRFGDNYFGKKLTLNDVVLVKYLETKGLDGNVESSGIVTEVNSPVYDAFDDSVVLYCTNVEPIIGGQDYEDNESIRYYAPKTYANQEVAISKDGYTTLILNNFSFVEKATCWGETEVNEDAGNDPGTFIPLEENVVHISAINTIGEPITESQQTDIRNFINNRKAPTDIIQFDTAQIVRILFHVNAYISDKQYTLAGVSSAIDTMLAENYSATYIDFKRIIRYSDYISKISQVPGVNYHLTNVSFYKYATFLSAYAASISLQMGNIAPSSVEIYVKDLTTVNAEYVLVASDNGTGDIVGEVGYTLTSSSVNYGTGEIALIFTGGLSLAYSQYSIRVNFETTVDDIIPTKRNQIIAYGDSDITATYI